MIRVLGRDRRQLLLDGIEPFALFADERDPRQFGSLDAVDDDALLSLIESRPFVARLQLFERPIDRFALAGSQPELHDLGQHGLIRGAKEVRVHYAKQVPDRLPAVLERTVQSFELPNRPGPRWSQLPLDRLQFRGRFGQELRHRWHDVFRSNGRKVGQT